MFRGHYDEWIISRMNGINKYILPNYFKSKTLLEVGCGHAHIGNKFYELGAIVTSCDARKEHIDTANQLYPHIKTFIFDADNDIIKDKYDIILHWGLLYHLNEIDKHLEQILNNCNILLLESIVSDSDNEMFYIINDEEGYDQSFNGRGFYASQSYIERILKNNGFKFKVIKDSILNSSFHRYDLDINNTNTIIHGMRCFWICWKNVDSPLIDF